MKIAHVLHRQNYFSLLLLLLISLLWSAISVHAFATLAYNEIPLREIQKPYYDYSYHFSTRNRYLSESEFRELGEYLQSLNYYDGADYLVGAPTYSGSEQMQGTMIYCSEHLLKYYNIPLDLYERRKQQGVYLTVSSARYCDFGDSSVLTLPNNQQVQLEVYKQSWPWDLKPVYNQRYFEGSAQLIFGQDPEVPVRHYILGGIDLIKFFPEESVLYPHSMTLFFNRALDADEEEALTRTVETYASLTSIEDVRRNSLKEANRLSRQVRAIPLITTVVFFFSALSISLLINYKTLPVQKVLRLNGMTKTGLQLRLIQPFVIIAGISCLAFSLYLWLIYALILPEQARARNASYNPNLLGKFVAIYAVLLALIFILTFFINSTDERKKSIYDRT